MASPASFSSSSYQSTVLAMSAYIYVRLCGLSGWLLLMEAPPQGDSSPPKVVMMMMVNYDNDDDDDDGMNLR